jgi:RNA polymerase sigma-70 factor (ECF subfamily)
VAMVSVMSVGARTLAMAATDIPGVARDERVTTGEMDEHEFQSFYSRTARPLRAYLVGSSGNRTLADDLLQESYYRLLRSDFKATDENHRRNYLFRIGTNLLRDHYRRRKPEVGEFPEMPGDLGHGDRVNMRSDLEKVLNELKPRDRQMLWLAYVEGQSHREIAEALELKTASIRPMLFRARQRMIGLMNEKGITS